MTPSLRIYVSVRSALARRRHSCPAAGAPRWQPWPPPRWAKDRPDRPIVSCTLRRLCPTLSYRQFYVAITPHVCIALLLQCFRPLRCRSTLPQISSSEFRGVEEFTVRFAARGDDAAESGGQRLHRRQSGGGLAYSGAARLSLCARAARVPAALT